MKRFFFIFTLLALSIFSINLVSAYSHCKTTSCGSGCTVEVCCDNSGYVICQLNSPDDVVCGKDSSWCDNYLSGGSKSCIPGTDWCCNDGGYIVDYSHHGSSYGCCQPDYPFYFNGDGCWNANVVGADNYFTKLSECDYLWNPDTKAWTVEESCDGKDYLKCSRNKLGDFIDGWDNLGRVIGKCGVECTVGQEKCEGTSYSVCEDSSYVNKGNTVGKCGVVCNTENTCDEPVLGKICQEGDVYEKTQLKNCAVTECINIGFGYNLLENCSEECTETFECQNDSDCDSGKVCSNGECSTQFHAFIISLFSTSEIPLNAYCSSLTDEPCEIGTENCTGFTLLKCENNQWENLGNVLGKCNYTSNQTVCTMDAKVCSDGSSVSRNADDNCNFYSCPSSNWLDKVLFKIGDFDVKGLHLLMFIVFVIVLFAIAGRK